MFVTHPTARRRRGTVLVMVIGVLAMLFMIGSTLLIVSRFERDTVEQKITSVKRLDASEGILYPTLLQLREDLVGKDNIAYNAGWPMSGVANGGDQPDSGENFGEFLGWLPDVSNDQPLTRQRRMRAGDLLLASIEPHRPNPSSPWLFFGVSWNRDYYSGEGYRPGVNNYSIFEASRMQALPKEDADGDGIADSAGYGGDSGYLLHTRVIPHGGMVLLSPFTHPALLAQAIHPKDLAARSVTDRASLRWLFDDKNSNRLQWDSDTEARLRRRFMLPEQVSPTDPRIPNNDIRKALRISLGYHNVNDVPSIHWQQYESEEQATWTKKMTPPPAMTDSGATYSSSTDEYDRRHLLTTVSSDDLLRRWREETRLGDLTPGVPATFQGLAYPGDTAATPGFPFYKILNPDPNPANDAAAGVPLGGGAIDVPVTGTANANRQIYLDYGRRLVFDPGSTLPVPSGELAFNTPGARSAFSLRDVLVDPNSAMAYDLNGNDLSYGYQASYRRAMQLTAFYLAMIQHTTVPGTSHDVRPASTQAKPSEAELKEQLRTAAQLAVNTIDFADNADGNGDGVVDNNELERFDPLSYFAWPPAPAEPVVRVIGFEKQPFITEVYAKVASAYVAGNLDFKASHDASIWAVEIYNPYEVALDLRGYRFNDELYWDPPTDPTSPPTLSTTRQTLGQALLSDADFTVSGVPRTAILPGERLVFANRKLDPHQISNLPFTASSTLKVVSMPQLQFGNPFVGDGATFDPPEVAMLRSLSEVVDLSTNRPLGPAEEGIVVDRLVPSDDLLAFNTPPSRTVNWARRPMPADIQADIGHTGPLTNTYWRHTSLQRRKEPLYDATDPNNSIRQNARPIYWHFTLALQKGFESSVQYSGSTQNPVHDLYGILRTITDGVDRYVSDTDPDWIGTSATQPIAGVPLLTSDAGVAEYPIDPTSGPYIRYCRAFPTTGTLLLVGRYGPEVNYDSVAAKWITEHTVPERLTRLPLTYDLAGNVLRPDAAGRIEQMRMIDNGHMPIVDTFQITTDLSTNASGATSNRNDPLAPVNSTSGDPQSQLEVPWGQLVFDYFTALPLETLSLVFSNPSVVKPYIDLYTEAFPDSPLIEPVSTASGTVFGGRVHGRLNINFAPWWLLDGLPAIPDAWNPAWPLSPSSVPVPQILRDRLDPLGPTIRPGQSLMTMLFDEPSASPAPPLNEPSISPIMAKAIVAYRERRPVDTLTLASTPPHYGCTSVGNLIDLITRLPMDIGVAGATDFSSVRLYHTGVERPYAYLGFLQLVTPLVRLQDWATVKSHVFTIYTLVGDPGNQDDPGDDVWLRSQATVDRTRCLYSNDLPAVITETPPISYYNVVNDQR